MFQPNDQVIDYFGRDLLAMPPRAREYQLESAFAYWRMKGFPFPALSGAEIEEEFLRLKRIPIDTILRGRAIHFSSVGLRLANVFHPQMWSARQYGHSKSPLDHFLDDSVLRKMLTRAMHHWPDRRCWNAQCLRSALRVYGGGRVANFRPSAAQALISRYSRDGGHVLDFSAGYGGRLLGAVSLRRTYVGIDADPLQYAGLRNLWNSVATLASGKAQIIHRRSEDALKSMPDRCIDLVISSPPYFSQEHYSPHTWQSSVRFNTYKNWRDSFLYPVLIECRRILKRGGHLVLNVKDTRQFPVAADAAYALKRRLKPIARYRLRMRARPHADLIAANAFGSEPVLIYRRR
jgi:tRNA1(Val) A37 N6-methylase TrmN6